MSNKNFKSKGKKKTVRNVNSKKLVKTKKKKIVNKKTFKQLNCSPLKRLSYTCYSPTSLNKLKKKWNQDNKEKKIKSNNPYIIWKQLKENLEENCSNEKCWLKQEFISDNLDKTLTKNTFAPNAPPTWKKDPNTWLNSIDINNIMHQYEAKYPNFKFIGPSPIDFDSKKFFGQCVWNDLCNFNLKNYIRKNINKIGIIFNTDPHYLSGAHWICIFINLDKNFIYYFDSNADDTPKEIEVFIDRVIKQGKQLNIDLKKIVNTTEHQQSNTECGMYVLYIITTLLEKKHCPTFDKRIPDRKMEQLRKIFFN